MARLQRPLKPHMLRSNFGLDGPARGIQSRVTNMAFDTIDAAAKRSVLAVQEYALLSGRAVSNIFRKPLYRSDIFMQADIIGVGSLPIVILTGFFLGGVL